MTDQDTTHTTTVDGFIREVEDDYDADAGHGPVSTRSALANVCLAEAIGRRDNAMLLRKGPLAVVVIVPSQGWVGPIKDAMRDGWSFDETASNTRKKPGASDVLDEGRRLTDALAHGRRVLGVSHAPATLLPPALLSAADVTITVRPPSDKALRRLIRWVTGKKVRDLPPGLAAGLDIDVLCAAIREGSTPADCVRRLTAASKALSGGDPTLDGVPHVRDLVGYGEAGEWARTLVAGIEKWRAAGSDPAAFKQLDRLVCLGGPPGTGKTTLARSVAASTGLPLISATIATLFTSGTGYLDAVLKAVDELFAQAAAANGVLLLDELDALPNRATMDARHREWWNSVVSHFLTTIDGGISGSIGRIIVIGCTNHLDHLDAALVRPGRLRPMTVPLPTQADLATILRQHLRRDLDGVDLTVAARLGSGATGAQAADWVKAARRDAVDADRPMALGDLLARIAPPDARPPEKILAVARHEAAHAAAVHLLGVGELVSVSVVSDGFAEGCTDWREHTGQLATRRHLEAVATALLCGRAADEVFGQVHAGVGGVPMSDLGAATRLVASIHASYGLADKIAFRTTTADALDLMKDPAFAARIEDHLGSLYVRAFAFVRTHRDLIDALARRLVDERVVDGDETRRLIANFRPAEPTPARPAPVTGGRHA